MNKENINYVDFEKVKMVTGTIINAEINAKAHKPAYILKIDFGPTIGIKTSSAQITNYSIKDLLNKQIVAVINFETKRIAGVKSEVLVLGAVSKENKILLISADNNFENGLPIA